LNVLKKKIIFRDGSPACKLPQLNIFNPEIMKFIHDVPPLQCSPEDWVKAEGSKLFIDRNIINQYGQITCSFNGMFLFYYIYVLLLIFLTSIYVG
jgi:hypothetical protein